jgi:hypothetical protein
VLPSIFTDFDNIRVEYPEDYGLGITLAGVTVKGRIDLLWAPSSTLLEIYDHKSVGNWKYAKTEEQLERDTQLTIYGAWAFQKFPSLTHVRYHHGQIGTKKGKAQVVSTGLLDKAHVAGVLPSIERTVAEMRDLYPETDVERVPKDTRACNAFGKLCPYAEVCPRSIFAGLAASRDTNHAAPKEGEVRMGLKEKMLAKARESAGGTAPAAEAALKDAQQAALTALEKAGPTTEEDKAALAKAIAAVPPGESVIVKPTKGVRAKGINPPDAAPVDMSKAGSYAATTTATEPPAKGETTTTAPTARLVLEVAGKKYEVSLPVQEIQ